MSSEIEEAMVAFRNTIPRAWWNVYQGCLQAGFNEQQSFILLQTYIVGQNPAGTRPSDGSGPKTDMPE